MPTVISTLASGTDYTFYDLPDNGKPRVTHTISIAGGAGVAHPKTLYTPQGVGTIITDDEAKMLAEHPVFKEHQAAGAVTIVKGVVQDAEKTARGLGKDKSAPVTPGDYTKRGKKAPATKKA